MKNGNVPRADRSDRLRLSMADFPATLVPRVRNTNPAYCAPCAAQSAGKRTDLLRLSPRIGIPFEGTNLRSDAD